MSSSDETPNSEASAQAESGPDLEGSPDEERAPAQGSGVQRRTLLSGGALAAAGATAGVAVERLRITEQDSTRQAVLKETETRNGRTTIPFYGEHQAGVEMHAQAHQILVGLTLHPGLDKDGIRRMMTILTDDASRLSQGAQALGDSAPEMAASPSRLTITFGFGPQLVETVNPTAVPDWLAGIPPMTRDKLRDEYNDGDLLIQIAADDMISTSHAYRTLLKGIRRVAQVKWFQQGFRKSYGSHGSGKTQRNLMGHMDGTTNPEPGSELFGEVVWIDSNSDYPWLSGGTSIVVRRIHMLLDEWDRLDRYGRERAVGRNVSNGAPLTGEHEHDEPDFNATDALGFAVIPEFSHVRRAHPASPAETIFRRSYNYEQGGAGGEISDAGMIFTSYQRSPESQFTPIQQRLDELDLLNEWIEHIGSAVFAVPPGCGPDGFIGESLF